MKTFKQFLLEVKKPKSFWIDSNSIEKIKKTPYFQHLRVVKNTNIFMNSIPGVPFRIYQNFDMPEYMLRSFIQYLDKEKIIYAYSPNV